MTSTKRALLVMAVVGGLLGAGQATIAPASASQTVSITPASPTVIDNCYPFGVGEDWTPFFGFVYQNVPAFQLKTGDSMAFDLGVMNDADVQLNIELAATTSNGGDVPQSFTTVVTNTQTPANPRGDTTSGNFELTFMAQAPFSFPGGGLIIRFSSPSSSYATDTSCASVLVGTNSTDASGNFVKRFFADADGLPPYGSQDAASLGGFVLTLADVPASPPKPVKKKCKQKKKKGKGKAAAKKKCKKKKKKPV